MAHDNIKSHKKAGFQSFYEKHIFVKTTWGSNWPPPPPQPAFLGLKRNFREST